MSTVARQFHVELKVLPDWPRVAPHVVATLFSGTVRTGNILKHM